MDFGMGFGITLAVVLFYVVVVAAGLWVQYFIIRTAVLHALQRRDEARDSRQSGPSHRIAEPTASRPVQARSSKPGVPRMPDGSIAPAGWYNLSGRGRAYWNGSSWVTTPS